MERNEFEKTVEPAFDMIKELEEQTYKDVKLLSDLVNIRRGFKTEDTERNKKEKLLYISRIERRKSVVDSLVTFIKTSAMLNSIMPAQELEGWLASKIRGLPEVLVKCPSCESIHFISEVQIQEMPA